MYDMKYDYISNHRYKNGLMYVVDDKDSPYYRDPPAGAPEEEYEAPYYDDLRAGKLRIYCVPVEHRNHKAYTLAIAWVLWKEPSLDLHTDAYLVTEVKMLEMVLLSDIMEWAGANPDYAKSLHSLYERYFASPDPEWVHIMEERAETRCKKWCPEGEDK